ncbi:MAG: hypothetical protein LBQ69_00465, partial [Treponema sp.]|nr:hypothetical protein [Treponema sp.]
MTFYERMMELLDQGMAASKEFAAKAGAKAQDLGERGILMIEIKQLEVKAQKILGRLGNEVYQAFAERNQDSIEKNAPEIEPLMTELADVRESLEKKETD